MAQTNKSMTDPVCGMKVQEENICTTYEGKHFCFCSESCLQTFNQSPEQYARKAV
ncbi:MAG TPA: YHS domain-containing protein [Candidatus Manganitrophaceae bacterium]|nr:YHS domain-containing protein [Candidatus Manganitrophaceae bacterium]